eukprot:4087149-Prymnesium_polylepis.1
MSFAGRSGNVLWSEMKGVRHPSRATKLRMTLLIPGMILNTQRLLQPGWVAVGRGAFKDSDLQTIKDHLRPVRIRSGKIVR